MVVQEAPTQTFYQEVVVQRNPQFVVHGLSVNQQIHYRITSSFDIYARDERGNRKAVQTVNNATLIKADPISRTVFTQSLAEIQGRKFTYIINKNGDIVSMKGHRDNTKAVEVEQPNSKNLLVSTLIDEDGWKELAQLTLFQPPQTGRSNRSFVRKTTHDWGSLGSWYGKTNYTRRDDRRNVKRFDYQHQLEYVPPHKQANDADSELPFSIENATFRMYEGWGEINYDQKRKHVTSVREVFHARGSVATLMAGIPSTLQISEKQIFSINVTGHRVLTVKRPQTSTAAAPYDK